MSYSFSWDCTLPINNIQDILSINIVPETKNYNEGNYLSLRGKIAVDGEYVANDQSRHPFREDIPLDIILPNNGRSKDIRAEVTNFDYEVKNGKVLFLKVDLVLKGYEVSQPGGGTQFTGQYAAPAAPVTNIPVTSGYAENDYLEDELPYDDDPFAATAKNATEPLSDFDGNSASDFTSWQNVLQGQAATAPSTNAPGSNFVPWQQAAAGQPFMSQSAQSSTFTSDGSEGVTGTGDSFDSYAAYLGRKEHKSHLPNKQVPVPVPAPAPAPAPVHHHPALHELHEEQTFGEGAPTPVVEAPAPAPAPVVVETPAPEPVPVPVVEAPAPEPVTIVSVEEVPEVAPQPVPAPVVHHPALGEGHYAEYFGAGQGEVATTTPAPHLGASEQVETFGGQGHIVNEHTHPALGGNEQHTTFGGNVTYETPYLGASEEYTTFGGGHPNLGGNEQYTTFGGGNYGGETQYSTYGQEQLTDTYEVPYGGSAQHPSLGGNEQYTTFGGGTEYGVNTGQYGYGEVNTGQYGYGEVNTGQYNNTYTEHQVPCDPCEEDKLAQTGYGEQLTDSYETPYLRPEHELGQGLKAYKEHGHPAGHQQPVQHPHQPVAPHFNGHPASDPSNLGGGPGHFPNIPGVASHGYSAVSQHQLKHAEHKLQSYHEHEQFGAGANTSGAGQATAETSNGTGTGYWAQDSGASNFGGQSASGTSTFGGQSASGTSTFGGQSASGTSTFGGQSASGTSTFGGQGTEQISAVQGIHGYSAVSQAQLNQAAQQVQTYNQQGNAGTNGWGQQGTSASGTSTFSGQSASGTSTFGGQSTSGTSTFGGQSTSGTSTFGGQSTSGTSTFGDDAFVSNVQSQIDDTFPFVNNQVQTQTTTVETQPKSSIFQMLGHLDNEYGVGDEELPAVPYTEVEQVTPILQEVVSPVQEEIGNFGSLYGNQVLSYYSKKISANKKAAEAAAAPTVVEERPLVASYFDSSVAKQFSDGASFIKVIFVQEDRTVESFCAEHDITEANIYNFESYDSLLKAGDRIMVNYGRRQ